MIIRPRRLRQNKVLRAMVEEVQLRKSSLIYPIFVKEGTGICEDIPSMPGQKRYSADRLPFILEQIQAKGIPAVMLFGIPANKDAKGSGAYAENGVVQAALRAARPRFPNLQLITDVCLCEYTSHGHCGILNGQEVDNDATLDYIAKTALSHVQAGADIVAPSDMMDGRIAAIRSTLDGAGHINTPILSYAVKYASAFYGPFREAAGSAPEFGDRKSYQMDYRRKNEALTEIALDTAEGADILMVKPALSYLDIISTVAQNTTLPVAAYSVSGEYAMIKAAAQAGWVDEMQMVTETSTAIFRAGANILLSYYAPEICDLIERGSHL